MENKKQAFTLAEVLLVLAIIGVIAAVTIPAIMQQSSEKKFSALAKKAQSTLQNAINLKLATTPIGPGDMQIGIIQWLLDGEEDGTNTLKAIKRNNTNNTTIFQTPDGMIFYVTTGDTCSTPSTRTELVGCQAFIRVDLNGSDAPTKATVENATNTMSTNALYSNTKAYDAIVLHVTPEGRVRHSDETQHAITLRTRKYLGLQ